MEQSHPKPPSNTAGFAMLSFAILVLAAAVAIQSPAALRLLLPSTDYRRWISRSSSFPGKIQLETDFEDYIEHRFSGRVDVYNR
jgi:hypothetical protein